MGPAIKTTYVGWKILYIYVTWNNTTWDTGGIVEIAETAQSDSFAARLHFMLVIS